MKPESVTQRLARLEEVASRPVAPPPQLPFDYAGYRQNFLAFLEDWTTAGKPLVTTNPMMEFLTSKVLK